MIYRVTSKYLVFDVMIYCSPIKTEMSCSAQAQLLYNPNSLTHAQNINNKSRSNAPGNREQNYRKMLRFYPFFLPYQIIRIILCPKEVILIQEKQKNISVTYPTNSNSKKVQNANTRKADSFSNLCNGMQPIPTRKFPPQFATLPSAITMGLGPISTNSRSEPFKRS